MIHSFLPPLKGEIPREGTRRAAVGACFLWDREAAERFLPPLKGAAPPAVSRKVGGGEACPF